MLALKINIGMHFSVNRLLDFIHKARVGSVKMKIALFAQMLPSC